MDSLAISQSSTNFPTYSQYRASAQCQRFSIPPSIIYYITKNPSTSKFYQKMIQCCKYFYLKNPILVLHWFIFTEDGWEVDSAITIPFNKIIAAKIWIKTYLNISSADSSMTSNIIPKIYQCDAQSLELRNQVITLDEFCFLSNNVVSCCFDKITVIDDNGKEAPCETIVANLPALKGIKYIFNPKSCNVSSKTVKELLKLPHFDQLEQFNLLNVSEDFDVKTFYEFLKKNKHIQSGLIYRIHPLSEEYKNELDRIVDEMLESNSSNYIVTYPGLERNKLKQLHKLWQMNVA